MKLTTFLLLAGFMCVSATGTSQKITISARNVPLIKIFKTIEQQSGYGVFYDVRILKDTKPVSIDMKDAPVEKVLQEALKDQPFDYSIEDKTIIISRKLPPQQSLPSLAVPPDTLIASLTGVVTDTAGNPLPGATIMVKGTKQGAVTNNDGEFNIRSVNRNAVLIVNFVGYRSREIPAEGRSRLSVRLETDLQALNDVVVAMIEAKCSTLNKRDQNTLKRRIRKAVESFVKDRER